MAVTKKKLIDHLQKELGLSRPDASLIVECFFEEILLELRDHGLVQLRGFGHFVVREKAARMGRNPKTQEEASISARRVVTFKASSLLKSRVSDPCSSG
jgi:integration host factor subunit alpha